MLVIYHNYEKSIVEYNSLISLFYFKSQCDDREILIFGGTKQSLVCYKQNSDYLHASIGASATEGSWEESSKTSHHS